MQIRIRKNERTWVRSSNEKSMWFAGDMEKVFQRNEDHQEERYTDLTYNSSSTYKGNLKTCQTLKNLVFGLIKRQFLKLD